METCRLQHDHDNSVVTVWSDSIAVSRKVCGIRNDEDVRYWKRFLESGQSQDILAARLIGGRDRTGVVAFSVLCISTRSEETSENVRCTLLCNQKAVSTLHMVHSGRLFTRKVHWATRVHTKILCIL